jgi:hypothetical protein
VSVSVVVVVSVVGDGDGDEGAFFVADHAYDYAYDNDHGSSGW